MKKLIFIFLFPVFSGNILLANASLFNYNEEKIYAELSELTEFEKIISENDNARFPEILNTNFVENTGTTHPSGTAFEFEDIQWDSFAWGFCCWPIGIFTVLINDNKNSNHKISYFIGLVTFIVIGGPLSWCGYYRII